MWVCERTSRVLPYGEGARALSAGWAGGGEFGWVWGGGGGGELPTKRRSGDEASQLPARVGRTPLGATSPPPPPREGGGELSCYAACVPA